MSYQVIARKYRPQRFSDVVGQEHVTRTLANAIGQKRIAHAYLFCGPRGTGKTTIARIFAKCLNCAGGPSVDFADDDSRCQEIAEGRSLDVLEIDGASNRGIEEIRELRERVRYAPATSQFKIYIIDEVHMLTKEAFNALLKTLEEPPAHVKFMFATTEPEKVLPTILSRCQRFDLRRIPAALIVKHLSQIARQEGVTIDDAALHAIARGADGGMRDAQCTLDQLISFCGMQIVEEEVLSMFGLTARGQVLELSRAVLAGEIEPALRQLHELAQGGKDLGRLVSDLLNHFRNLLIYQVSKGDLSLVDVSEAEASALKQQAPTVTTEALTRIMEVLANAEGRLREAPSKRILLEVTLLKAIQARNAINLDRVLKQLQSLRDEATVAGLMKPAPRQLADPEPATTVAPTPRPGPAATPMVSDAPESVPTAVEPAPAAGNSANTTVSEDLAQLWARVVAAVGRVSPFARSYLLEAHPVSLTKQTMTIGFDPEFADHLGLVDNSRNRTLIQTKLQELGYGELQVKFIQAEAPPNWIHPGENPAPEATAAPAPASGEPAAPAAKAAESKTPAAKPSAPLDKERFQNDPLIKQALEIFKGQIVEVRA